jgi:phosphate starvation-inducible protein PhoH and related proteins
MTPRPDRGPRRELARAEAPVRDAMPATEVLLSFDDNRLASLVFGHYDQNLAHLERRLGVVISPNGNQLTVKGPRETAEQAGRVLKTLYARAKAGASVTLGEVDGAIEESNVQRSLFPSDNAGKASFEAVVTRKRGPVRARNAAQDAYLRQLKRNELVLAEGPAGTGKTWLAVGHAVSLIEQGVVERMVLSRPAVEAGERLGFLPGDMREKVDPYLRPIYDALNDFMEARHVERALQTGMIEIAPLAFMRGRTLTNAVVLLDEAQNATSVQMKMFLTRLGEGSRMIITGDPTQIDLPGFEEGDVVRHDLVRRIVMAYESAARREREEREERMRAPVSEPQAPIESETEGLKRTLSRERPR